MKNRRDVPMTMISNLLKYYVECAYTATELMGPEVV